MNDGVVILNRAGAQGSVVADYLKVVDSGRVFRRGVDERLARIVAGSTAGQNRDLPVLHLSLLIDALNAAGFLGSAGRWEFFLGMERVTKAVVQAAVSDRIKEEEDWSSSAWSQTETGLKTVHGGEDFEISYGYIPTLIALFEFLVGMEDGRHFQAFDDIFEKLGRTPGDDRAIKDASNAIASKFRDYRTRHIEWAAKQEKFDRISKFLDERAEKSRWRIDDQSIFDFWILHWEGKGFKEYRTVMTAFIDFKRLLATSALAMASETATPLGTDKDSGEIDPEMDERAGDFGEWSNPLSPFSEAPLNQVNFFKGESENAPLRELMRLGPDAVDLPIAFLRLEAFSPIQSEIVADLRFKRGADAVASRLSCSQAQTYDTLSIGYDLAAEHVERVQRATLHAVADGALEGGIADEAERAFRELRRKGFGKSEIDEDARETFEVAADLIVRIGANLNAFRRRLDALKTRDPDLNVRFTDDSKAFSNHFATMYGDAS